SGIQELCGIIPTLSSSLEIVRNEMIPLIKHLFEKQDDNPYVHVSILDSWILEIMNVEKEFCPIIREKLHKWGYIIPHEDMIILDSKWLADILKKIVSYKSTHLSGNSITKAQHLKQLFKDYKDHSQLILLLLSFNIILRHPEMEEHFV